MSGHRSQYSDEDNMVHFIDREISRDSIFMTGGELENANKRMSGALYLNIICLRFPPYEIQYKH